MATRTLRERIEELKKNDVRFILCYDFTQVGGEMMLTKVLEKAHGTDVAELANAVVDAVGLPDEITVGGQKKSRYVAVAIRSRYISNETLSDGGHFGEPEETTVVSKLPDWIKRTLIKMGVTPVAVPIQRKKYKNITTLAQVDFSTFSAGYLALPVK
jgi:hypothetical protein